MTSFISALSLLILVLANGYFTLPVVDDHLSSSTFSSLHDDLTTEHAFNLRLVPDEETTEFLHTVTPRSFNEHMEFEVTTSANSLLEENASRASRIFDEHFTFEPSTFTTKESHTDKRDHHDFSSTTVESFIDDDDMNKREMKIESTTRDMLFTSTVAPELYTTKLPISTSTKKYTGLLKDEKEYEEEYKEYTPERPIKSSRTGSFKPKPQPEDKSEEDSKFATTTKSKFDSNEDSKEPTAPTAVFDQDALKKLSNIPNDIMILDENNDVVTSSLEKFLTTTIENTKGQKTKTKTT